MSETGYLVVSEEPYGGTKRRVFMTAQAMKDAENYATGWVRDTAGKVDVIIVEIDVVQI